MIVLRQLIPIFIFLPFSEGLPRHDIRLRHHPEGWSDGDPFSESRWLYFSDILINI